MAKRALHRLSTKAVANEKTPGRYADGGGLYLQVGPTGTRSWLFRFMLDGKSREMGLGPIHTVGLADARERATECRRMLLDGVDPIEARSATRTQERLNEAKSKPFRECAAEYIKAHRAGWRNEKHAGQWESTIETYCFPTFDVPVSKIDAGLVLKVLEPMWHTKPETASRLRGRIESVLDWATVRGYREGLNPARWRGHLDQTLPARSKVAKVEHHAALPFDDVPAFLRELEQLDGVAPRALRYLILTCTRTAETIGAVRPEIDAKRATWTIPGERMKAGREHKVPLSRGALAIVDEMKDIATGDYVFPSVRGDLALSNMALLAVLKRMGRADLTVHGFRSSFRDWASERTNFPREVVEMALAHAIGDKVEAAYRRGDLFEKRRKLMDAWAAHCAKSAPATVHSIRKTYAIEAAR